MQNVRINLNQKDAMSHNPIIFTSLTVTMQRLMDTVLNGYSYYCCGSIGIDRCTKLVKKFDLNYRILADRNERARRKRLGLGNAMLVLWLKNVNVQWWLLITTPDSGDHAAHTIEILRDANTLKDRIEVEGYELVRLPKKAVKKIQLKPVAKKTSATSNNNTRLTWRMNRHKYLGWRASVIESVRGSSACSLEFLIYRLWSSPGFSGIRSQIGNIAALYRAEIKRTSRKDAPVLPKRLGYLRRLNNTGITLAELAAQFKAQAASQHLDRHNIDVGAKGVLANLASDVATPVVGDHSR